MRGLICLALLLAACSRLPQIRPLDGPPAEETLEQCRELFPKHNWQLLHRIRAELPNGRTETLLGVSQIFPGQGGLHCVLMTIEGLVLLEAEHNGELTVQRAVPPFDKPGVAEGMLADIRLIFLAPTALSAMAGLDASSNKLCRYELPGNQVEEITILPQEHREIKLYDGKKHLRRSVSFGSSRQSVRPPLAASMSLSAHGLPGYRLEMTLLEAEPLTEN